MVYQVVHRVRKDFTLMHVQQLIIYTRAMTWITHKLCFLEEALVELL
jgi:hypothetical protein